MLRCWFSYRRRRNLNGNILSHIAQKSQVLSNPSSMGRKLFPTQRQKMQRWWGEKREREKRWKISFKLWHSAVPFAISPKGAQKCLIQDETFRIIKVEMKIFPFECKRMDRVLRLDCNLNFETFSCDTTKTNAIYRQTLSMRQK